MSSIHDAVSSELTIDSSNKSFTVSGNDFASAVRKLKAGKIGGNKLLSSEFFIAASSELDVHLPFFIAAIIMYGDVSDVRIVTISPIPKPRAIEFDAASYRGI